VAKKLDEKVWSAEYVTKDQGDYRQVYGYYQLPDLPLGQYFIHVHAGNHDYIEPWVNTDMAFAAGCELEPEQIIQPEDLFKTIQWLLSLSPGACVKAVVLENPRSLT